MVTAYYSYKVFWKINTLLSKIRKIKIKNPKQTNENNVIDCTNIVLNLYIPNKLYKNLYLSHK
ncbi:hypothetical protein B0A75_09595 [Flavobacterium oncorhynchi]|uniref:Uncharacterized protein n=1 Tax=Flavobacterium oncorhynchi TaxID=728056 RepID=A0A226I226_9FLAO|nr:hypothetical protein B0A75_09595 [Flavobacterium oncorhynchi]RXM42274.1 hypothetical protein BOW57_17145 [Flavobacterium sp. YO64]RXM45353.1 hypothetical protein BOW55_16280 [Flavobacterium sp. YO12]